MQRIVVTVNGEEKILIKPFKEISAQIKHDPVDFNNYNPKGAPISASGGSGGSSGNPIVVNEGDKLKSIPEFEDQLFRELCAKIPEIASQGIPSPGTMLDRVIKTTAHHLYDLQHAFNDLLIRNSPRMESQPYQPDCCKSENLKWYDSGFSRYQYCDKCGKKHNG